MVHLARRISPSISATQTTFYQRCAGVWSSRADVWSSRTLRKCDSPFLRRNLTGLTGRCGEFADCVGRAFLHCRRQTHRSRPRRTARLSHTYSSSTLLNPLKAYPLGVYLRTVR